MLLGLGSLCVFQFGSSLSFVGSTHHMLLALGSLCIFPCAPCFQLRAGRVLFITCGAHWGPVKYEGASRVSRSGFKSHLCRFLQLSVQTGVFVCFSVCPLFSITGWPCPVHCPWHTLGTRQIRGGNACCWVLGLCVFFSLVAVCPL